MRATKYLVVVASCVVLLAVVAWLLRDYLTERISNPILAKYGIAVTDVSLDALAANDASISYLELVHSKGTTIAIEDLTLPIRAKPGPKTYTARKVSVITASRTDGAPLELASLVAQFLSLPDTLDNSVMRVAEFSLPPYPLARDLQWDVLDGEQRLSAVVGTVSMSVTIRPEDEVGHDIELSVSPKSIPVEGDNVRAELMQGVEGISVSGTSSIDLPHWVPLLKLAGTMPPEIELPSGTATLQFNAHIPNDATLTPTLTASIAPDPALQLRYSGRSGDLTTVIVETAGALAVFASFPEVDWSLRLDEAALAVTHGEWREIPVALNGLSCRSGPTCSMTTRVAVENAEFPLGRARQLALASTENVSFPTTGPRVDVRPGATLSAAGLDTAAGRVKKLEARLGSTATLDLVEAGWRLAAASVDARIESMSVSDDAAVSLPLFLEDIRVDVLDDGLAMNAGIYAPSMQASFRDRRLALPGVKGRVSLQENELQGQLETVGLEQNGTISATHGLDTRTGNVTIRDAVVSFGKKNLSGRVSPWPLAADLVSGTAALEFGARWRPEESGLSIDARASIAATKLGGYYGDTAFTGLSTRFNVSYRAASGFMAGPSAISVALVETGLPIENLSADYVLDLNESRIDVDNLRMSAVGGVIKADPFSFRTDRASNTLMLTAESLDLRELLSLQELEAIEVSGSIGATLPVTIEDDTVTIVDGTLTGDPGGGVIRYSPAGLSDPSDTSGIGFATRVLSNFEFDTLTSDVNLTRDGDLNLKLRLTGRNPDLEEKRPVVLNLGVENNIPQMLRSLRAARAVEEVLEKRLGK